MKHNKFGLLLTLVAVFMVSGCEFVVKDPSNKDSSFPTPPSSSEPGPTSNTPEPSSNTLNPSSSGEEVKFLTLGELAGASEGQYYTKGTITRIINYTNQAMMDVYIHDLNTTTKAMDAMLIKNIPSSVFLAKDYEIQVKGTLSHQKLANDVNYSLMSVKTASDVSVTNKMSEVTYESEKYSDDMWSKQALYNINHYVALENLSLADVNVTTNNDEPLIVCASTSSKENIEIRIDLGDKTLNAKVASDFTSYKASNSKLTISGFIGGNVKDNVPYPYLRLTQNDDYQEIKVEIPDERKISMYGINDFHGSVKPNTSSYEAGIAKIGSFFKKQKQDGNTLLFNSGDMWQGSIESNYNHGELLTNCMNYIEFDCFTLGNHEFDWGQEYIVKNMALAGKDGKTINGYQTPFLAANIYKYDINTNTTKEYANLGQKYTIRTLENGLRVGIIGVIGYDQITSINSQYVDDLTFLNPVNVIKDLSDELRNEKNVDVVAVSLHGGQSELLNTGITETSFVSNKRYVDAVFCAHTHLPEVALENGVPFVQAGSNGKYYGNIELVVDKEGNVTCESYAHTYTSKISTTVDPVFNEIMNPYFAKSDEASNEKLGTLDNTLASSDDLVNLVTHAMAYQAKENGFDIDYAISNTGRANLEAGEVTYGELYRSLPFDNIVYIIDVKGKEIRNELKYNNMYRLDKAALDDNKTYRIATIDYLAFHRNSRRQYNYFPSLVVVGQITKAGYEIFNYREITREYLKSLNGTIKASDYSSTLKVHDTSLLNSKI